MTKFFVALIFLLYFTIFVTLSFWEKFCLGLVMMIRPTEYIQLESIMLVQSLQRQNQFLLAGYFVVLHVQDHAQTNVTHIRRKFK